MLAALLVLLFTVEIRIESPTTPESACKRERFAILSMATAEYATRWSESLRSKNVYAARHGYAHIVEMLDSKSIASSMWAKPNLIARCGWGL